MIRTVNSSGLKNRICAKRVPGTLHSAIGFNTGPDQYVQLHDSAVSPEDGAVPVITVKLLADSHFSIDFGLQRSFDAGIWLCNSTSADTLTAGAEDCLLDLQFL